MFAPPPLCSCEICLAPDPSLFVAPVEVIDAFRERSTRQPVTRITCPRCAGQLGCTEVVVDEVGYAHFVQPCLFCVALWVI